MPFCVLIEAFRVHLSLYIYIYICLCIYTGTSRGVVQIVNETFFDFKPPSNNPNRPNNPNINPSPIPHLPSILSEKFPINPNNPDIRNIPNKDVGIMGSENREGVVLKTGGIITPEEEEKTQEKECDEYEGLLGLAELVSLSLSHAHHTHSLSRSRSLFLSLSMSTHNLYIHNNNDNINCVHVFL